MSHFFTSIGILVFQCHVKGIVSCEAVTRIGCLSHHLTGLVRCNMPCQADMGMNGYADCFVNCLLPNPMYDVQSQGNHSRVCGYWLCGMIATCFLYL